MTSEISGAAEWMCLCVEVVPLVLHMLLRGGWLHFCRRTQLRSGKSFVSRVMRSFFTSTDGGDARLWSFAFDMTFFISQDDSS
jgi:hypothetical protein